MSAVSSFTSPSNSGSCRSLAKENKKNKDARASTSNPHQCQTNPHESTPSSPQTPQTTTAVPEPTNTSNPRGTTSLPTPSGSSAESRKMSNTNHKKSPSTTGASSLSTSAVRVPQRNAHAVPPMNHNNYNSALRSTSVTRSLKESRLASSPALLQPLQTVTPPGKGDSSRSNNSTSGSISCFTAAGRVGDLDRGATRRHRTLLRPPLTTSDIIRINSSRRTNNVMNPDSLVPPVSSDPFGGSTNGNHNHSNNNHENKNNNSAPSIPNSKGRSTVGMAITTTTSSSNSNPPSRRTLDGVGEVGAATPPRSTISPANPNEKSTRASSSPSRATGNHGRLLHSSPMLNNSNSNRLPDATASSVGASLHSDRRSKQHDNHNSNTPEQSRMVGLHDVRNASLSAATAASAEEADPNADEGKCLVETALPGTPSLSSATKPDSAAAVSLPRGRVTDQTASTVSKGAQRMPKMCSGESTMIEEEEEEEEENVEGPIVASVRRNVRAATSSSRSPVRLAPLAAEKTFAQVQSTARPTTTGTAIPSPSSSHPFNVWTVVDRSDGEEEEDEDLRPEPEGPHRVDQVPPALADHAPLLSLNPPPPCSSSGEDALPRSPHSPHDTVVPSSPSLPLHAISRSPNASRSRTPSSSWTSSAGEEGEAALWIPTAVRVPATQLRRPQDRSRRAQRCHGLLCKTNNNTTTTGGVGQQAPQSMTFLSVHSRNNASGASSCVKPATAGNLLVSTRCSGRLHPNNMALPGSSTYPPDRRTTTAVPHSAPSVAGVGSRNPFPPSGGCSSGGRTQSPTGEAAVPTHASHKNSGMCPPLKANSNGNPSSNNGAHAMKLTSARHRGGNLESTAPPTSSRRSWMVMDSNSRQTPPLVGTPTTSPSAPEPKGNKSSPSYDGGVRTAVEHPPERRPPTAQPSQRKDATRPPDKKGSTHTNGKRVTSGAVVKTTAAPALTSAHRRQVRAMECDDEDDRQETSSRRGHGSPVTPPHHRNSTNNENKTTRNGKGARPQGSGKASVASRPSPEGHSSAADVTGKTLSTPAGGKDDRSSVSSSTAPTSTSDTSSASSSSSSSCSTTSYPSTNEGDADEEESDASDLPTPPDDSLGPLAYHHYAIHRLLALGFHVEWSTFGLKDPPKHNNGDVNQKQKEKETVVEGGGRLGQRCPNIEDSENRSRDNSVPPPRYVPTNQRSPNASTTSSVSPCSVEKTKTLVRKNHSKKTTSKKGASATGKPSETEKPPPLSSAVASNTSRRELWRELFSGVAKQIAQCPICAMYPIPFHDHPNGSGGRKRLHHHRNVSRGGGKACSPRSHYSTGYGSSSSRPHHSSLPSQHHRRDHHHHHHLHDSTHTEQWGATAFQMHHTPSATLSAMAATAVAELKKRSSGHRDRHEPAPSSWSSSRSLTYAGLRRGTLGRGQASRPLHTPSSRRHTYGSAANSSAIAADKVERTPFSNQCWRSYREWCLAQKTVEAEVDPKLIHSAAGSTLKEGNKFGIADTKPDSAGRVKNAELEDPLLLLKYMMQTRSPAQCFLPHFSDRCQFYASQLGLQDGVETFRLSAYLPPLVDPTRDSSSNACIGSSIGSSTLYGFKGYPSQQPQQFLTSPVLPKPLATTATNLHRHKYAVAPLVFHQLPSWRHVREVTQLSEGHRFLEALPHPPSRCHPSASSSSSATSLFAGPTVAPGSRIFRFLKESPLTPALRHKLLHATLSRAEMYKEKVMLCGEEGRAPPVLAPSVLGGVSACSVYLVLEPIVADCRRPSALAHSSVAAVSGEGWKESRSSGGDERHDDGDLLDGLSSLSTSALGDVPDGLLDPESFFLEKSRLSVWGHTTYLAAPPIPVATTTSSSCTNHTANTKNNNDSSCHRTSNHNSSDAITAVSSKAAAPTAAAVKHVPKSIKLSGGSGKRSAETNKRTSATSLHHVRKKLRAAASPKGSLPAPLPPPVQKTCSFFIANSLEDYFRLSAAFGWIYGWQLCYAPCGPPEASTAWLKLFNPSAYHVATQTLWRSDVPQRLSSSAQEVLPSHAASTATVRHPSPPPPSAGPSSAFPGARSSPSKVSTSATTVSPNSTAADTKRAEVTPGSTTRRAAAPGMDCSLFVSKPICLTSTTTTTNTLDRGKHTSTRIGTSPGVVKANTSSPTTNPHPPRSTTDTRVLLSATTTGGPEATQLRAGTSTLGTSPTGRLGQQ